MPLSGLIVGNRMNLLAREPGFHLRPVVLGKIFSFHGEGSTAQADRI